MKKYINIFMIIILTICFLTSCSGNDDVKGTLSTTQQGNNQLVDDPINFGDGSVPTKVIECDSNVKFVRTNFAYDDQFVMIIKSVEEINAYKDSLKQLEPSWIFLYIEETFDKTFSNYNESYFENNILYIAVIVEGSGSIRHNVLDIEYGDDTMTVTIERLSPDVGTCDMAQWHLLVEVKRDDFDGNEGKLEVRK